MGDATADRQSFGQWLRHHRRELDLTQAELSQRVGCAPITIRKIEADEMRPSKQLSELLLEQLGVPVEDRENFIRFARGGELAVAVAAAVPRHNLPHPVSSFIGREHEIAEVKRLIGSSRLITLTGVGGGGKTRLALQVARDLVDGCKDGVWWVELAALREPSNVPQAFTKIFNLPDSPNQQTSVILANYLQGKQSLLVVDNCEHLIEECAHLIESLLSKCVNLKFMVTSREPLAIMGEMVYQVFPLSVPMLNETSIKRSLQSESVRLFVDRAREATSGFSISDQNFAAVIRVCQRLDGIPLAIELAARVTSLTVEHIAERLDDRFNLLTSGSRTALPRQQTLRATIEWSHDLLPERTRILFRRLSVFPGGFGREAVEAICSDENLAAIEVLKELSRLVDRSLLEVRLNGKDERYRMLETIRLFAHEQLQESGEEKRLREKHLKYFTEWAEEVEPRLRGPEQLAWWDRMEIEHDNIRTALGWSLEGDAAQFGLRLACAAYWFWFYRCYWREGLKWFKDLLAKIPTREQTSTRAKARVAAGILAWNLSPKEPVEESYNESIQYWRKIGDQWWAAYGLGCSGWYSLYSGDPISSQTKFKQAVSCARKSGDGWILGYSLHGLGAAVERINYGEAVPILEESIEIWRKVGVKEGLAEALNQLGTVAHGQNDDKRALPLYEESLALFREIGSKSSIGMVQLCLAELLQRAGDNTRAARLHTESLTIAADLGDQKAIADNLFGLAGVAGGQSKPRRAARLLGAAQSIYDSICMNLSAWPYVLADYNRWVSTARAQLDEAAFTTAYEQGKAMTPDQAIKYARDSKKDG